MAERKPNAQRSDDVADLFRVLRAMSADPEVSEAHFRIAFRIAQFVKASTGWASVSDDALCDYLPRTEGKKIRLCRRQLESLGWIRTIEGARGRPTAYLFLEARVTEIEKQQAELAAKREAEFALRKSRELSKAKSDALRARIEAELPGKISPLIEPGKAGNLCPDKGEGFPPLLPKRSTYRVATGRVEDMAHRTHGSAPAPARAVPPSPLDEAPMCGCGEPAVIRARLSGNSEFQVLCQDCADDLLITDARPV